MTHRLLIAMYGHPEAYPPTLNALDQLSELFDEIDVLHLPALTPRWRYPQNVNLVATGPRLTARETRQLPTLQRYRWLVSFAGKLAQALMQKRPELLLIYDPLALLAYRMAAAALPHRPLVWYHNHDVIDETRLKPLSQAWFAKRAQTAVFDRLDVLSLPSMERKAHFPMERFHGRFFFLPNVPSLAFYGAPRNVERNAEQFRLIFQGHIGEGHGIENLLSLMPLTVAGRSLHLTLVGLTERAFKERLDRIVAERGLTDLVDFAGYRPYGQLPELTASCHAGLAIYEGISVMNRTVGTASNKIYEYASVGLPVIYYDSPHFREHLGRYRWAIPCDLSSGSIMAALERVAAGHEELGREARLSFEGALNYERYFAPIREYLCERLKLG